MPNPDPFVWYDLLTTDTKAAADFYRSVIGWTAADSGLKDRSYTLLSMGDAVVGGIMPIPPSAAAEGARPMWNGYIGVEDVDQHADRVKAAGGHIHHAPEDLPSRIGRFAVVADPQGAVFTLFEGGENMAPPSHEPNLAPGHFGWNELQAADGPTAFDFYADLFGWTKGEAHDMGPMGVYQVFSTGGAPAGGIMTKAPQSPAPPHWLFYINVEAADAAVDRLQQAGGQLLQGPHQVPGGGWIVVALDPQGAVFALVAPKR